MAKIEKILDLLGIEHNRKAMSEVIKMMIENVNNLQEYCKYETILFSSMGVDTVTKKGLLTESELQDLHDKIKFIMGMGSGSLNESQRLYSYYFESGRAGRDINNITKIKKDDFKWNNLSENMPDVSGDKSEKFVVFDSMTNTYKGKPVTPKLIYDLLAKGIILVPSQNVKAQAHINR